MGIGIGLGLSIGRRAGIGLGGGGWTPTYLLRDDFITDEAAPLASPRAAEPGPETLTLVQTDGEFSIAAGKLAYSAQATPVWGDLTLVGDGITRVAGRALLVKLSRAVTSTSMWIGINNDATPGDTNIAGVDALRFDNSASLNPTVNGGIFVSGLLYAAATEYDVAIVYRAAGVIFCLRGGAYTDWTFFWVSTVGTGNGYPAASVLGATGSFDTFRVLDLPAPFDTDYGLATQRLAGARSAADTFVHEAGHVGEATITTRPSAGQVEMRFRIQDANNYWQWTVDSAGAIDLDEVVAGTPTQRATSAAGLTSGHRVVWIADGTTIRVYSNNALRFTYASATNFATATSGELETLGTGGAVSDIISWPRTLTGTAATLLDAAIA